MAQKVAYIDEDGQDYYDALHAALYPPANLISISCVYTQSGTVYDTDTLDSLKSDLVVTAHFSDNTTQTVTTYTLSGTLTEGTSTITVSYSGKTTTFTVTVTHAPKIPATYQEVEYIQATGTQRIETDIAVSRTSGDKPISGYTYDIDYAFDSWQSEYATNIFSGFGSQGGYWIGYSNTVQNIAMGTSTGMYFTDGVLTDRHQYHFEVVNNVSYVTREDGEQISRSTSANANGYVYTIFGYVPTQGTSNFHSCGKFYGAVLNYNGVKVADLVPCYRKSDGEIGVYDAVNDAFYTNAGTGTFIKGSDV